MDKVYPPGRETISVNAHLTQGLRMLRVPHVSEQEIEGNALAVLLLDVLS